MLLPLDRTVADIVALSAAGVAVLSLLVAVVALARVGRLRGALHSVAAGADPSRVAAASPDTAGGLRHVAVVRYDAFQDMGGRMSFSAALLDDAGDGIVLTAINGRSETRSYAKGVSAGTSEHTLSPEELQAIEAALGRSRSAAVPARRAG